MRCPRGYLTVSVYAPGASGMAAPARVFTDTSSIFQDTGMGVDGVGNVYVMTEPGTLNEYAANDSGNVSPIKGSAGNAIAVAP